MASLGLYGSLKDYVKQQLKVRRAVLSNPRRVEVGLESHTINAGEENEQTIKAWSFDSSNDFQTNTRSGPEQFYAYTTQKSCTIRMASGVDMEESARDKLFEDGEKNLLGNGLSAMYILQGGTINASNTFVLGNTEIRLNTSNPRGGINNFDGAYGDPDTRSDGGDGFGIVPMPGIIDAKINTVSKEGALREAVVNFSCHSRRQLEILETLYMRPGYNVLLEWAWTPYIDNFGNIENNDFSAIFEFFKQETDFDKISKVIRELKEASHGNYDGFFGYVKNFSYKAREDGGYDCTTELISSNSLLESLQAGRKVDFIRDDNTIIVEDEFLYYLKSIQKNLQKAGDEYYLQFKGTDKEKEIQENEQFQNKAQNIAASAGNNPVVAGQLITGDAFLTYTNPDITTDRSKESEEVENTVRELNNIEARYLTGFKDIEELVYQINKGTITDPIDNVDPMSGIGIQSILNSTILKNTLQYDEKDDDDNGLRTDIYVRWDLICQIINHLITDHYKEGKPVVEITYTSENTPTTFNLNNTEATGSLDINDGSPYYIPYTAPNNLSLVDPLYSSEYNKFLTDFEKEFGKGIDGPSVGNKEDYHPLLGQSYDHNICLLPHMSIFDGLFSSDPQNGSSGFYKDPNFKDKDKTKTFFEANPTLLTSYLGTGAKRESIGLVYFNLEYIIREYENMRLETVKAEAGEETVYTRFRDDFNMVNFLKTIWGSVNNACAGFYNFDVHTEFERPHIARVVETNFKQDFYKDELFEFRPQGLESITRNFMFESSISKDMASIVSIAAQVPNEEQSLEALSFKAFHKNIKSRFTSLEFTEKEKRLRQEAAVKDLSYDITNYMKMVNSLRGYMKALRNSDFSSEYKEDSEGNKQKIQQLSPKTAIKYAKEIEELRQRIANRYPLGHPEEGFFRPNTTHERSAIVPLEFSLQLDGISGLIPYQVFRISSDKLPFDYGGDDVAFIIKNESQTIGSDNSWVTDITGQLVLLNINPNNEGIQDILTLDEDGNPITNEEADEVDELSEDELRYQEVNGDSGSPNQTEEDVILSLDVAMQQPIRNVLATLQAKGWQTRVKFGHRTVIEQKQIVDRGHSNAPFSHHTTYSEDGTPAALAVDIIDRRYAWNIDTNHQFWADLGEACVSEGLLWGGNWTSFQDVAHCYTGTGTTTTQAYTQSSDSLSETAIEWIDHINDLKATHGTEGSNWRPYYESTDYNLEENINLNE